MSGGGIRSRSSHVSTPLPHCFMIAPTMVTCLGGTWAIALFAVHRRMCPGQHGPPRGRWMFPRAVGPEDFQRRAASTLTSYEIPSPLTHTSCMCHCRPRRRSHSLPRYEGALHKLTSAFHSHFLCSLLGPHRTQLSCAHSSPGTQPSAHGPNGSHLHIASLNRDVYCFSLPCYISLFSHCDSSLCYLLPHELSLLCARHQ